MSKSIYYKREVMTIIKNILADEISAIVHGDGATWENSTAEQKITTIEGMYMLAAAIDEHMREEDE